MSCLLMAAADEDGRRSVTPQTSTRELAGVYHWVCVRALGLARSPNMLFKPITCFTVLPMLCHLGTISFNCHACLFHFLFVFWFGFSHCRHCVQSWLFLFFCLHALRPRRVYFWYAPSTIMKSTCHPCFYFHESFFVPTCYVSVSNTIQVLCN